MKCLTPGVEQRRPAPGSYAGDFGAFRADDFGKWQFGR
jgi:hypothetical protein